ncbi:MAG: PAS domain S-box protein, partial [Methanomicrobiales archaeon]|nr:PAS domain S-box protein [Methanomicrobiales archaeon]
EELRAAYEQLTASQEQLQGQFLALKESQDQIAESEEKYRNLVEHTDDGVFIAQDGNLIFVNEPLANRVGYTPHELIGKSFAFLVAPEDRDLVTTRHHQRLSGQTLPDTYEFSLLHRDGNTRYLVRIRVGTGRFHGAPAVIGTLHDVTEERAQQAALAESEARFRGLTEQSLDTIMLFDQKLRHRYVSPMAEKISGIPVAAFIGKTHAELGFPAHLVTIWEDALKKTFSTGRMNRIEFLLPTSGIWIDWQLVPVMGPDGKVTEVIASSRDITDRKKAEEALRESEEKYRDLVENANIIILKWDKSGNITFFNTYAQRFFGYTKEEIIGKPVVGTIVPVTESTSGRDLRHLIDDIIRYPDKHTDNENENITRDGRRVWIRWQNKPLFDKNGEFIGQICIGSDNTDRKKAEEALAKSEELHRKMIVTIPDVVVTADLEGTITFINDQGVRLAGVTDAAAIVGKSMFSFFAPESLEMARENTRRMFEGPLGPKEYLFLAGGNRNVTLEVNGDVLRTPDGKPYGLVYICRDITERRLAQDAIRQSEELYRSLADASPDGIAILDTKGYLTYVSPKALEMFGVVDLNEAIGTHVLDWLHPSDRELARQQFAPVLSGAPHDSRMYRMQRKDKSSFVIEMHSSVFHDSRGSVKGIISILRDITERQKAEQALRESEDNYRRIIENMQDVFYRLDNSGNITMLSTYGAQLMGCATPEEVIGKLRVDDVYVNLDERNRFLAILHEKGVVTGFPLTLKDHDGNLHAATASSRVLYDKDGNVTGTEGILHDVTKIREVETALRQANRQIMLMTRITRHDIRNQLLALNGWLELSRASVDDPDRMLDIIDREQKIAANIGHQIEFTTVFDDMGLKPPVWHNLPELIQRAAAAIPFNPVEFACAVPAIEVLADPLLEKVFYNLFDNALRYGGSNLTHVRVSVRDEDRALVLVVEDNGAGIPKSDKERIFEQGFGKNTGLGLFLAREVLSITGITIHETGTAGRGARFEISVPRDRYRFMGKDPSLITANPS